jgi:hypothetical protein
VRLLATQWTAPYLVVSHSAAAWLWGIELPCPEAEFTATHPHIGRHRSGIHRTALPDTEVTELHGLRCTTVDRTLADLLRQAPQDDAIIAVESALTWRRVRVSPHRAESRRRQGGRQQPPPTGDQPRRSKRRTRPLATTYIHARLQAGACDGVIP